MWSAKKKFVTREDYEKDLARTSETLKRIEEQTSATIHNQETLELALNKFPTAEDMHRISLGIAEIRGDMQTIAAKMDGHAALQGRLELMVNMLHEVHLENRK